MHFTSKRGVPGAYVPRLPFPYGFALSSHFVLVGREREQIILGREGHVSIYIGTDQS